MMPERKRKKIRKKEKWTKLDEITKKENFEEASKKK